MYPQHLTRIHEVVLFKSACSPSDFCVTSVAEKVSLSRIRRCPYESTNGRQKELSSGTSNLPPFEKESSRFSIPFTARIAAPNTLPSSSTQSARALAVLKRVLWFDSSRDLPL